MTGALGQIGSELAPALRECYGAERVVASDVRMPPVMDIDRDRLVHHNAFNVTAMSATPAMVAAEIQRHAPGFEVDFEVDPVRQAIADGSPDSLDDSAARAEWGWPPRYDLPAMTTDMLDKLKARSRPAE